MTEPLIPALMKPLLDQGFQAGALKLWIIPVALLGLFGVRGAASFCAQYLLALMSNRTMHRLRTQLFLRLQNAHPSLYSSSTSSSLINTVVYEVQIGTNLLVNALLSLIKDSLTLLALVAYLLFLNWQLTLIVVAVFPFVAWVMKVLSKRLHALSKSTQTATDELAYVVEENVLAYRTIRLHNAHASQSARFDALNTRLKHLAMKSTVAHSAMTPVTQLLAAVALSAVICIALWQSASSGSTVGGFVAFTTAMLMLVAPMKHLSEVAGPVTRGFTAIERGLDLLELTITETGGTHKPSGRLSSASIAFKNVSVRYPSSQTQALTHLNLIINAGETVAFVGPSGSGKTTLANTLARFVDASEGEILVDGVDVRQWDLAALRSHMAFVSQDVVMLSGTVAENVALGEAVDRKRAQSAIELAHLGEYVAQLALGMDTQVGHNALTLSGGQRQRLAIARAIYKDAPILVLDEATSALDAQSEQAVKEALQTLTKGRTTLVIAHRFSTIEHASRIVVMEGGKIAEMGSHAQLMQLQGVYFRLRQLDGRAVSAASPHAHLAAS